MRMMTKFVSVVGALVLTVPGALAKPKAPVADDDRTLVIIFKDGHEQTFRLSEIARIEFSSQSSIASVSGRAHFLGVWKVGIGNGNSGTFLIKLKPDGVAEKTLGSSGGKWTVVSGEARCSWDDGWTDVIRKVGGRWEKAAYSPGSSLDGKPAGVAEAVYTEPH
jgi:hypothetical protein